MTAIYEWIQNDRKIFKISMKYTNILHSKYTHIGIFGMKICHLATLVHIYQLVPS
jgi:hypothetical protein